MITLFLFVQAKQSWQPPDRILSGADAEALEDGLGTSGVTHDIAPATHPSGQRAQKLADRALGTGSVSIADMLREVEAKVGSDWRNRGEHHGLASTQKKADEGRDSRRKLYALSVPVSSIFLR